MNDVVAVLLVQMEIKGELRYAPVDPGERSKARKVAMEKLKILYDGLPGMWSDGLQLPVDTCTWLDDYLNRYEDGHVGSEVGIEEFGENLIGISREFHRN
jgi:hypothetical protein